MPKHRTEGENDAVQIDVDALAQERAERMAFADLWAAYKLLIAEHNLAYCLPEYPEWLAKRAVDKRA